MLCWGQVTATASMNSLKLWLLTQEDQSVFQQGAVMDSEPHNNKTKIITKNKNQRRHEE